MRNSGATAVVEGVGDHGCEYMTNGLVLVLGSCGRNFAAGMSGGIAYVFDERGDFTEKRCNLDSVDLEPLLEAQDVADSFEDLVTRHLELTGSRRAKWILDNWPEMLSAVYQSLPARVQARAGRAAAASDSLTFRASPCAAAASVQLSRCSMGKTTGFMDYSRELAPRRPVAERVNDWFEIYQDFPEDKLREQGARCMDCGVPVLPDRMPRQQSHSRLE